MNPTNLKEVIQQYQSEEDTLREMESEIKEIKKSLPEAKKGQIYDVDTASQLIQNAIIIEKHITKLEGLKADHEATRKNVENLLKKIPEIKVKLGNGYFIFENETGLREGGYELNM